MATTIVERDSSPAMAILIFVLFAALVVGGLMFAYNNGMVGRSTVIENHKTVVLPSTPAPSAPEPASAK